MSQDMFQILALYPLLNELSILEVVKLTGSTFDG